VKVIVNESLCDGYGKCERVAPDLFKLDEDGIAHVLVESELMPEQFERAKAAVNLCPVSAISLVVNPADLVERIPKDVEAVPQATAPTSELTTPFERHVFVCTSGEYCPMLDGNSVEIHKAFKEQAAKAGLKGRVRINKSGCLDQCGHGPTVVVYPEGVWYSHLTLEDVPEIVEEHLKGGHPVERLRYHPPKAGGNKLERNADNRRIAGQVDGCRPDWPVIRDDDPHAGKPAEGQ